MKWTKKQQRYIEWCATPSSEREPSTQAEMADVLGVSRMTVWRWQKKPGFWVEVDNQIKAWVGKRTPDILGAHVTKAIAGGKYEDGDVPAAKLVLGYAGKYEEKRGGDTNILVYMDVAGHVMLGMKGLIDELIGLFPEEGRTRAIGLVEERLGQLEEAIPTEVTEAGVFRPLLQDKK